MAQQAEVPGATWLGPARWFTRGRVGPGVRFVVIHYTAGAEGRTAAENGASYDRRRPDRVSTHFFTDADSIVQEVLLADTAYAAFHNGNALGVQIEICGTLQTRDQWLDPVSDATLTNTARLCAQLCVRFGLEPRRLTHAEMRATWATANGPRGIVGHVDCTQAYGQGDHTDPGPHFPWDVLLERTAEFLRGMGAATQDQSRGGLDMIKVVAVQRGKDVAYYGWAAGQMPVDIPDGTTLEQWRALARAALQPTDLTFPAALFDATFRPASQTGTTGPI